jgi:hypothetical protein
MLENRSSTRETFNFLTWTVPVKSVRKGHFPCKERIINDCYSYVDEIGPRNLHVIVVHSRLRRLQSTPRKLLFLNIPSNSNTEISISILLSYPLRKFAPGDRTSNV